MADNKQAVVVAGDITIDWSLARSRSNQQTPTRWDPQYYMQAYFQSGGASLLGKLIEAARQEAQAEPDFTPTDVFYVEPEGKHMVPGTPPYWHSYAVCAQVPKDKNKDGSDLVWRVKEFLGIDRQPYNDTQNPAQPLFEKKYKGEADIIVLAEAHQGFRDLENVWPEALKRPKRNSWMLLKLGRPDFRDSKFWEHISEHFESRLIVVVTADDLRLLENNISRSLSWERIAADAVREISTMEMFPTCAHCVVSMHTDGALVVSNNRGNTNASLFFDPKSIEGGRALSYEGTMIGYTQCIVAGIALEMMWSNTHDDIGAGILSGLSAARLLLENGYKQTPARRPSSPFPEKLESPNKNLAEELFQNLRKIKRHGPPRRVPPFLEHPLPTSPDPRWTILGDIYKNTRGVEKLAKGIVKWGHQGRSWDVPIAEFGNLVTIDRKEIESLRAIRSLIAEYRKSLSQTNPLSIAVFGSPGSGKSFTIKEVARSLESEGAFKALSFNLSQFSQSTAILDALHQVRDEALSGIVPLVFWDEFDTKLGDTSLGWLRYFLAPMQDGKFQSGSLTHNIGRAIFVFAGGTRESMKNFERDVKATKKNETKGEDFVSRLKGYVDIPSLNHTDDADEPEQFVVNTGTMIRRALLLRSILLDSAKHLTQSVERRPKNQSAKPKIGTRLNVDTGVLNAFLHVRKYNYGARSMESIVRMSMLAGRSMFERSSLPAEAQLNLHVNAEKFLELVRNHPADSP